MKKVLTFNSFALCLTALLFGIIGCSENSAFDNNLDPFAFESGEFAVFDFNDAMDGIQDATLSSPMQFDPNLFNGGSFRPGGAFGQNGPRGPRGPRMGPGRRGNHLGEIFRQLNLNEEQRTGLRDLMAGHRECIQEPLQAFRDANQALIDAANEQRQAIKEAYQNGEISIEEAREQLRALNESTRAAIENNPDSQAARQGLCDCKLAHFENVRAILTEAQQATWDDWVAGLEGFCFSDGN